MLSGPGPGGLGTGWSWPRHPGWRHSGDLGEFSWGLIETSLWLHGPETQRHSWGSEMGGHTKSLHRNTRIGAQREAPGTTVHGKGAFKSARLIASANSGTAKAEFSFRPQAQSKKIGTKDDLEKEVPSRPAPVIWVSLLCPICHHLHQMNPTMTLLHSLP